MSGRLLARARRAVIPAGLALASLACGFLLVETAVRIWASRFPPPQIFETRYAQLVESLLLSQHPFYPDVSGADVTNATIWRRFYTYKPGAVFFSVYPDDPRGYFEPGAIMTYVMNAQGFRDQDFRLARTPGVRRVAVVGDSFTLGEGVRFEGIFTERLDGLFRRTGPPAEVLNFGISGYGSKDEIVLLERTVLPFRPDLVVLAYVLNDIAHAELDDLTSGMERAKRASPWFRTPSRAVTILAERSWNRTLSQRASELLLASYADPARWGEQRAVVAAMDGLIRGAGARLLVVILPDIRGLARKEYPFAALHRQLADFLTETGIPWMDLRDSFRKHPPEELQVHPVDHHPNEIAHRIIAEEVHRAIMERGLLAPPPP